MNYEEKCIIDLHIHSNNSDGAKSTEELLEEFDKLNMDIVSFTDHNNVKCYYDLANSKVKLKKEIIIIPGVELCFAYNGEVRHMLGYGIKTDIISKFIEKCSIEQKKEEKVILKNFKENCKKLNLKFDKEIQIKRGYKYEAYTLMWKSLNAYPENLIKYPIIENNSKFYWEHVNNKNSPFFIDSSTNIPNMKEIVELIHKAKGLAFLSHPFIYNRSKEDGIKFIAEAIKNKVDGIELKHYSHTDDETEFLKNIARENNLYTSGGSDHHDDYPSSSKLIIGNNNMLVKYDDIKDWLNIIDFIKYS